MLPKENRMNSTYEFNNTRKFGIKLPSKSFDLFYIEHRKRELPTRIGIVATLKFSPLSPVRNRAKRIFRELVRGNLARIHPGYLLVIHPKRIALETKYEDLSLEFNTLLSKVPFA